jgi:chorismate mutase/prephenate dehydratase
MPTESIDRRLLPLREAIDALDARLVDLLNERARLAAEVGRLKGEVDAPVLRTEREAEVVRKVTAASRGPLPAAALANVFREIMSACRALERPLTVAFLGPAGTFSEMAMHRQFGTSVSGLACATLDEVFRATEAGSADVGIVPLENSTEGAVSRTLDLLLATPLKLMAELSLTVDHNLLTRSGTMDDVHCICAHSQALAQCAGWLAQHYPQLERRAVSSNAEGARLAAEEPGMAAIAGQRAAERYALVAVATHIQDDPNNRTRFAVLGRQATQPSRPPGRDKTSLILSVPNRAGAVFHMLEPLSRHGVSMTRFESRPARVGTWEYYFYVDVEGHQADAKVATALAELQKACAFYKCLGSYPAEL